MSNKIILVVILVVGIIGIGYWFYQSQKEEQPIETQTFTLDAKNCTYLVEGQNITLINGYSEEEIALGSASKIITKYFGNEVTGDFNNDGFSDVAFLFTQETGGSGTFYYVAVALGSKNKCLGTNAIFLGDRIAPQTINFQSDEIIVNYADRNPDEPMTASPSVGISKYFKINEGQLVEIQR